MGAEQEEDDSSTQQERQLIDWSSGVETLPIKSQLKPPSIYLSIYPAKQPEGVWSSDTLPLPGLRASWPPWW